MKKYSVCVVVIVLSIICFDLKAQDAKAPELSKYQKMAHDWNTQQFVTIKKKAAFDTSCDSSKMKLTILETRYDANGGEHMYGGLKLSKKQKEIDLITATSVGVDGCGQKSTYVLMPTGGWMLNSNSQGKK